MRPLAIDLFCGLGGWTDGLLAEGYAVYGFDIERHQYWVPNEDHDRNDGSKGTRPVAKRGWTQGCAVSLGMEGANAKPRTRLMEYPAQLVIQDVLTLHGKQFKDAALIVASPPCQAYSYRAMPWKRAKALPPPDNSLFDACFRIQREACEAAGRHIPLIVENVRGAQKWVGRSRWNFGSFHLWGDVPALMPIGGATKLGTWEWDCKDSAQARLRNSDEWFNGSATSIARHGSKSKARKAASAKIAKIPFPLAQYIARTFKPNAV